MPFPRRSNRGSAKKRIQSTRWDGANHFFGAATAGVVAQIFATAGTDTETLLRIRGELVGYIDGLDAPPVAIDGAVGIALVPEGSGTTPQWSPLADDNAPWLMYERFTLGYEEYVTDVIQAVQLSSFRRMIDVKAQRIIRPDIELQIVMESATISGAGAINVSFGFRALLGSY